MNRERILRQHLSLRVFALLCAAGTALAFAGAAQAQRYVVVYEHGHVASPVAARNVSQAGGQVVATYSQIGVVIAESSSPTFEAAMERLQRVHGAAATAARVSRSAASARIAACSGLHGGQRRVLERPGSGDLAMTTSATSLTGNSPSARTGDPDRRGTRTGRRRAPCTGCASGRPSPEGCPRARPVRAASFRSARSGSRSARRADR